MLPNGLITGLFARIGRREEKSLIASEEKVNSATAYRSVEETIEAIKLALETGFYSTAGQLANTGVKLFPDSEELQKFARVLAPPRVIETNIPPSKGLKSMMRWISAYGAEYRGEWIALRDEELLAHAERRADLMEQLGNLADEEDVVITKIPASNIRP